MTSRAAVDGFLAERTLALVGASRSGRKFGNAVLKALTAKGYRVLPVHPDTPEIDGHQAYPSLAELPEKVGGVIVVVPPIQAEQVVRAAAAAGIGRVWLQQGASSPEALAVAEAKGLSVVHGECILMFAEPTGSFHRVHRLVWKVLGRLPH
jgi:predicted CoA-binding protein